MRSIARLLIRVPSPLWAVERSSVAWLRLPASQGTCNIWSGEGAIQSFEKRFSTLSTGPRGEHPHRPYSVWINPTDARPNCSQQCTKTLWVHRFIHQARRMSATYKPIATEIMEESDIEQLREEIKQEKREGRFSGLSLTTRIKQTVVAKCDQILANLPEEDHKQLKILQLEYDFWYSEGYEILPLEEMTSEYWLEALKIQGKMSRLKYYMFLQSREHTRQSQRAKERAKLSTKTTTEIYEHGRLFMRIYESTMRKWHKYRLASAMQFGTPLVFDMNFESHMRAQDIRNTASQLMDVYSYNRQDEGEPFHLHMLNCTQDNSIYKMFEFLIQDSGDLMVTRTDQSYLDLFDRRELIYLSPNGRQVMRHFDPHAVYIVGAFNDKKETTPVTYARAKMEGITCQRLPLDEYLNWGQGRKDLTLDQVMRILLALKNKQSWDQAFKVIPQRKLASTERKYNW